MAGRETADIVFCMDASGSMDNAFDGVRDNVEKLVKTLNTSGLQTKWDVRFDFLAYSNTCMPSMRLITTNEHSTGVINGLYNDPEAKSLQQDKESGKFFTRDLKKFCKALDEVECEGDESTLLALDLAADFPFRDAATCHRVVVLLTDEAVADGPLADETNKKLMNLAMKYQDKKIMLFMVTPDCPSFDQLSQIDKCEWTVDETGGLHGVNFSKLMESIGKSVSISQTMGSGRDTPNPLFCESKWTREAEHGNHANYVVVSGVEGLKSKLANAFD